MSKEKQIEEMAKDICRLDWDCPCMMSFECKAMVYAKRFYEAGYRKASEVAREIFEEIEKFLSPYRYPIIAELKKKYTEGEE